MDKFLKLYWSAASTCSVTRDWKQYQARSWYHLDYVDDKRGCKLQINVIDGTFLVDGLPCKNLPRSILSHDVFQRLFGQSTFMVQPCGYPDGTSLNMMINFVNSSLAFLLPFALTPLIKYNCSTAGFCIC